ncbi:aspartic proteinase [Niveomyces insectorum RCEF 264]|uniref:Aspartic proteinase n=1 Tax=Niveomyces insectorum RCEF 264 TaxID=1081102 RepID=A0A167QC61_9HYPO|nr:aspartic proteinase [Niveomyces insectorum RCEF 264]
MHHYGISLVCLLLLAMTAVARPATGSGASLLAPRNNGAAASPLSVSLVRNHAYARNGPAEYEWARAKYAQFAPGGAAGKVPASSIEALNQSYDREYLSPVYLGTPGQLCYLDLDTGSSDLWLFSSRTPAIFLEGQRVYSPERSSTALAVSNASWSASYGDGSYAGGSVYRDTVRLGELVLPNVTVEAATYVSRSLAADVAMSGILGLAFHLNSTPVPHQPTLLDTLVPRLGPNTLFAVDLKHAAPGAYHFGYVNASSYTGDITWRPLQPNATFWQFDLQAVHIGGDNASGGRGSDGGDDDGGDDDGGDDDGGNGGDGGDGGDDDDDGDGDGGDNNKPNAPIWRLHDWPMVADTGTTLLLLPADLAELYWSFVPGAVLSETDGGWVFPCNATLPDFSFGFADGWNASVPGRYLNFQNLTAANTRCYGGIQATIAPFGILGDAFLKALYVIFDVGNARLGLATKTLTT